MRKWICWFKKCAYEPAMDEALEQCINCGKLRRKISKKLEVPVGGFRCPYPECIGYCLQPGLNEIEYKPDPEDPTGKVVTWRHYKAVRACLFCNKAVYWTRSQQEAVKFIWPNAPTATSAKLD